MKRLRPLEFMIAALLASAAHLAACTPVFSFSVYNDASITDDESMIYGYTSTEDTSTLCSCVHSGYEAIAVVYDPDGTLLGDAEVSGFSSSVSAPMDGVSGEYQSSGAGVAYCSCLQGYFGGGGTIYYVAATCPTTATLTSQTAAPLSASLPGNFPTIKTGVGMVAIVAVGPGSPASYNGSLVTETVTNGSTNTCPAAIPQTSICVGSDVFTVGPNSGGSYYGTSYNGSGNGQFLDFHSTVSAGDVLSAQAQNYSCSMTCSQKYSACSKQIGSFTLTFGFQQTSINQTPVTKVTVTEQ